MCNDHVDNNCDGLSDPCGLAGAVSLESTYDAKLYGEAAGDELGEFFQGGAGGDHNGDGNDDVLVGAYRNDQAGNRAGAAYLMHGPPVSGTMGSADFTFLGEAASDGAGVSAAGVGDASGSGAPDVAVGTSPTSTPAGDVNGDGYGDLVLGAFHQHSGGTDAGALYLLYGEGL